MIEVWARSIASWLEVVGYTWIGQDQGDSFLYTLPGFGRKVLRKRSRDAPIRARMGKSRERNLRADKTLMENGNPEIKSVAGIEIAEWARSI